QSSVLKYRKVTAKGKEVFQVVLNETPFYAESGGQVGDRGWIGNFPVVDTKKDNDLIIHFTESFPVEVPATIEARVDGNTRMLTAMHHTATHLVHAALRKVLGT